MALPFSAPAERNRQAILDVLMRVLPAGASVLEIASGTGQHAAHAAGESPGWRWQPTDVDEEMLPVIDARCAELANVAFARRLDVLDDTWSAAPDRCDAVFCANMLHIAPWPCCAGLMRGAARTLGRRGKLILYGPYLVDQLPTAPGNIAFDADLRRRDPRWGLRRLIDVDGQATLAGLALIERVAMPANNLMLVFERADELARSSGEAALPPT